MSITKRTGPNPPPMTREQAVAAEIRAIDAKGETTPMRIGASIPVVLIRRDFQEKGLAAALETGRACFYAGSITDEQIAAIAREEATLRGYSDTGISYHDKPCATCGGKGKAKKPVNLCSTCEGDGFAPPSAEMSHRRAKP